MAKNNTQYQNTTSVSTKTFTGGMIKDTNDSFTPKESWSHAINATVNSHLGDEFTISNESANKLICTTKYDIIGYTHLESDKWVLFSTNDVSSEIGIFDESDGKYEPKVNQNDLRFNRNNIITAVSKKNPDCSYSIYWCEKGNPDRYLNFSNIPYKKIYNNNIVDNCKFTLSDKIDIEKLRLSPLIKSPSYSIKKGISSGSLLNGSYSVIIAYSVNGIRVTDYFTSSNIQSIWSHENSNGSIQISIDEIDQEFTEFELVVLSTINLQTTAKKVGNYSTSQKSISIDYLSNELPNIPLSDILIRTPNYDKSDNFSVVNNYLLRIGVQTESDFNYQPQANQINIKWVAVELPADYYEKGGNLTSYMRDERQPFFIRWVYNSGKRSADYPLIGRSSKSSDLSNLINGDSIDIDQNSAQRWKNENTATITNTERILLKEGIQVAEGEMGYWESTELYPSQPEVWGDLCGKPIRHSKFPNNDLVPHFTDNGNKIVILGVKFENISHPLDQDGNPISNIVGYEFLKASREGNKTVIAKGILNNMGKYTIDKDISDKQGLYPNYPYNDLRTDPFLSKNPVKGGCQGKGYQKMGEFSDDVFTFHSPDTQFRSPYLSNLTLEINGELSGEVIGSFQPVAKHPRHKLVRDFALVISGIVGIGQGLLALKGKTTTTYKGPQAFNSGQSMVGSLVSSITGGTSVAGFYAGQAILGKLAKDATKLDPTGIGDYALDEIALAKGAAMGSVPGVMGATRETTREETAFSELPTPLKIAAGVVTFGFYFSQGMEATMRIIKNLIPYQQYAYQYTSHGFYNQIKRVNQGNKRRKIINAEYLEPHLQEIGSKYRINNLFRSRCIALELEKSLLRPSSEDNSRVTIGSMAAWDNPKVQNKSNTSAYYATLKVAMDNQFGQIDSMTHIPISSHIEPTVVDKDIRMKSSVIFGGDIYINRYTEKNTFFYFNEWMNRVDDGFELDYRNHYNIPYPRYWVNTQEYDISQFSSALVKLKFNEDVLPNDMAHLDRKSSDCKKKVSFVINNAYFYLFNSGIRDFFVESEINLAQRDYGESPSQRHYDYKKYTDLKELFHSDIIKLGDHYKYDYSLSVSKSLLNQVSWGSILPRDYDPSNQKCFSYYHNRVLYSLQQQEELKKDNWLVYLANNYKDFPSQPIHIKEINGTGAIIFFKDASPMLFQGIDSLQLDSGIKITVGDGGLFHQPLQSTSNAERSYEFGSCQNKNSILSTVAGIFWMSVDQGKIFTYGEGMQDITQGLSHWFSQYLPFKLLEDFPNYEYTDNPVKGISSSTIYDNTLGIVYFSKKDYALKSGYKGKVDYNGNNKFKFNNLTFELGDPTYFDSASFTVSYYLKQKFWISYHDWQPSFMLPSKNHFLSIQGNQIWKHNDRHDLYCNYYGINYPFLIEYDSSTGQEVTTLRSIEYQLEVYKYLNNGRDAYHVLDENFDRLIVHNSEQNSGLIKLLPKPKGLITLNNSIQESEAISLYYSKEENKYRINGITDLTRDRGEFSGIQRTIWITEPNGYIQKLNPSNLNYNKSLLQRKKMRHYNTKIRFQKNISGENKFIFKIANNKQQLSVR